MSPMPTRGLGNPKGVPLPRPTHRSTSKRLSLPRTDPRREQSTCPPAFSPAMMMATRLAAEFPEKVPQSFRNAQVVVRPCWVSIMNAARAVCRASPAWSRDRSDGYGLSVLAGRST